MSEACPVSGARRNVRREARSVPSRRLAAMVASAGVALLLIGCTSDSRPVGEGRLDPASQVLLTDGSGQPITATRGRPLQRGDSLEVFEGTARITLPDGQELELQPRSVLVLDGGPELRRGDLLVTNRATSAATTPVRAAGSEVSVSGATRITFAPSLRVVAYQGTTSLRSGGRQLDVPALRSADVSLPGLLPGRPSPMVIDRADPWVGRFLRDVVESEAGLESRSRGFTSQVSAKDASSPEFYLGVLPGLGAEPTLARDAIERFGRAQPNGPVRAGEVLLGSAVALQGRGGTIADRLTGAAAFRAEGASWALVAADQQVPSIDAVLRLVDGAVNVAPIELAAPPPSPSPTAPTAPVVPAGGQTTTTRPPTTRRTPNTPSSVPPPQPRVTAPVPAPPTGPPPAVQLDPLIDTTLDPIVDLLDDLLNGR